ncbi:hypothetical protein PSAC2689_10179 [Paraburkholderia sacchari]
MQCSFEGFRGTFPVLCVLKLSCIEFMHDNSNMPPTRNIGLVLTGCSNAPSGNTPTHTVCIRICYPHRNRLQLANHYSPPILNVA